MTTNDVKSYQFKCRPAAKGSHTHTILSDDLPEGGTMDVTNDPSGFLDAMSVEVDASRVGRWVSRVYERLRPSFRFFVQVKGVDEERAKRLFSAFGSALRDDDRGDNVFYPGLDLASLRCVVLHDTTHMRFVFPDIVVDSSRALRIHRYILERLSWCLDAHDKSGLLGGQGYDRRSFSILPLDAWKTVCPSSVYVEEELGMPVYGCTAATRCTAAVPRRGKGAHKECDACSRTGYVPMYGRVELLTVLRDATDPEHDVAETARLKADTRAALCATMLCTNEELTTPFLVPTYAPAVPTQTGRHGQNELADVFECERTAFGKSSRNVKRVEYDPKSNQMRDIEIMSAAQSACRRMHNEYRRVSIKQMYRIGTGPKAIVRIHVDGSNATFCMGKQRRHEGQHACRASFTIKKVDRKVKIFQECFSPECMNGKNRYCSNGKEIPARLATHLGFSILGNNEDDKTLHRWAAELFKQMRDER